MPPKRKLAKQREFEANKKFRNEKKLKLETAEKIQSLADEIQSHARYNNFVILLSQFERVIDEIESGNENETGAKIETDQEIEMQGRTIALALYKCFQFLHKEGKLRIQKQQNEGEKIVTKWLLEKYQNFKNIIAAVLKKDLKLGKSLELDLLDIILKFVKLEGQQNKDKQFPIETYKLLIEALMDNNITKILSDGLADNFLVLEFINSFQKYWDLQFYFFNITSDLLGKWKDSRSPLQLQKIVSNFVTIIRNGLLFNTDNLEQEPTWISKENLSCTLYKHTQFKSQFQKCISTILAYPLISCQYKSLLLILHKRIIPYLSHPQSLMDFLTDSYNIQQDLIIPILALNSLYELMKNYNVEYSDFYTKLYSLLRPELLYTRYRSRFFRLCDLFLSSTHLSANLVASFIKKLAKLSLTSSAPGTVLIIPFIYNLLKRHPTCMIMIHNTSQKRDTGAFQDPFNNHEMNPMNTNALNSSLWELETLMSHYHPNIATLAKIFSEPFRKPSYNLEDFLDWSYKSLLETEKSRKYKSQNSALEYEEFDSIFDNKDNMTNVLLKGWTL
ncbi:NOC4 [Candida oxycetoniae]|uniref:NOC4 n=1 Tax=Candida oxycetoniae TaxID=497107 RepID=A0AAI9T0F6_9ASCO|nr:NOC4 [Candida oxycetoniae]KAI3406327.2 NOC4 [Candida oxycetoniae]